MSYHVISCHIMSYHVISCHIMSYHVIIIIPWQFLVEVTEYFGSFKIWFINDLSEQLRNSSTISLRTDRPLTLHITLGR